MSFRIRTRLLSSSQKSSFDLNRALELARRDGALLYTGLGGDASPEPDSERPIRPIRPIHLLGYEPIVKLFETHWEFCDDENYAVDDPLKALDEVVADHQKKPEEGLAFEGGFVGFCAYDLKNNLEEDGLFATFPQKCPKLYFVLYRHVEVFCLASRRVFCIEHSVEGRPNRSERAAKKDLNWREQKNLFLPPPVSESPDYGALVRLVRERIEQGDVYQINLSRRVAGRLVRPMEQVCKALLLRNPTRYQGVVSASFGTLVSTSPEGFFEYHQGLLSATPIKGTAPRSANEAKDERLREGLLGSRKNLAELAMITDLFRNDFARIPETKNIEVKAFPVLTSYQNVHHLSSWVGAKTESSMVQVLKTLFPSGSITGCPKIKACQSIDALESESRGVYTGSLGYLSFTNDCAFNVLIRTAFIRDGAFEYRVGGGITLLSDPRDEFLETVYKEQTLKDCLL